MYADYAAYVDNGGTAPEAEISPRLDQASRDVDAVTFSRIPAIGFGRLTEFQRGLVVEACCIQADFLLENADAVDSSLSRYSINGVSMEFGNDALYQVVGGTPMSNAAMALLRRTGLTALMAYRAEVDDALA